MAKVQVTNISILDNPTEFSKPFKFEVTFDCPENLPHGETNNDQVLSLIF